MLLCRIFSRSFIVIKCPTITVTFLNFTAEGPNLFLKKFRICYRRGLQAVGSSTGISYILSFFNTGNYAQNLLIFEKMNLSPRLFRDTLSYISPENVPSSPIFKPGCPYTVVPEKKGTFICESILERYIYLRNTQKQLKITIMFETKVDIIIILEISIKHHCKLDKILRNFCFEHNL